MQAHAFRGAVNRRHEHRLLSFLDRDRQGALAGPNLVGRYVMIVPLWNSSPSGAYGMARATVRAHQPQPRALSMCAMNDQPFWRRTYVPGGVAGHQR